MRQLHNERGNVLTYVLLTVMIIMIMTPVILSTLSTNQLANKQTEYDKIANSFALSGMEAFIQYLDKYDTYGKVQNIPRIDYFNNYGGNGAGWGLKRFTTPDGTLVTYEQKVYKENTDFPVQIPILVDGRYDVVFTSTVKNHTKSVKFNISAFNEITYTPQPSPTASATPGPTSTGSSAPSPTPRPETVIIPGEKVPIPPGTGVLYGDTKNNVNAAKNNTIKPAIDKYIRVIHESVTSKINEYLSLPQLITCNNCSINKIKEEISNSPANTPVFIYRPGTLSINGTHKLGSSTQPVILIADNFSVENSNISIYGSLIANQTVANPSTTGNFTGRNQNTLITYQSASGKYGDYWVEGKNETGTQTTFTIANSLYAGSLIFKNGGDVFAKEFTVNGLMDIGTNTTLTIAPGNMSSGSINIKNNAAFNVSSGDIFVSEDFAGHTQIHVTTGGIVAVGGSIDLKNSNSTFNTGQSNPPVTSLQLSGTTSTPIPSATASPTATPSAPPSASPSFTPAPSSSVPPTVTPTPWNPIRK